jgi:hypothetical protein
MGEINTGLDVSIVIVYTFYLLACLLYAYSTTKEEESKLCAYQVRKEESGLM